MKALNIREFPEALLSSIKVASATKGMSLKDWVIAALEASVDGKTLRVPLGALSGDVGARRKAQGRTVPRADSGKKKLVSRPVPRRVHGNHKPKRSEKICSTHGIVMKDYGTKWLCEGPPVHSEVKRP